VVEVTKNEGARRLVIGVGNPERGDDAAGPAVARRLRGLAPGDVTIVEHDGEPARFLAEIADVASVFAVDACVSGAPPGTIRCFDALAAPLPDLRSGWSTHGFGLATAIELARSLGQLPPRIVIFTIEGQLFESGGPLSPPVAAAVDQVARKVLAEIGSLSAPRPT
jgi:hydrogenase maturation protease